MKILAVVILLLAIAAVILLKKSAEQSSPSPEDQRHGSMKLETKGRKSSSEEMISAQSHQPEPLPRLIDLGADKCIPCKMMAPILEELKEEYKGTFEVMFIDVWKDPAAGRPWGIRLIPTQIFLDGAGKELYRHEGFFSKEDILKKWEELGIDVQGES